jgi:hypothetical protein
LRVVGLPDTVWLRRLATVNKIEVFTVALIALVSENKETFRQVTGDAIDSPVARRAFTRRSCKLFDLTVYRSDWKGGSLKRQTFDCGLELRRNGAPRSFIVALFAHESDQPEPPVLTRPTLHCAKRNTGLCCDNPQ